VVPDERDRTSPRLAGAFVLDSDIRGLTLDELAPVTLWCPSTEPADASGIPDASAALVRRQPGQPGLLPRAVHVRRAPRSFRRESSTSTSSTPTRRAGGQGDVALVPTPEFATTADHVLLDGYGTGHVPERRDHHRRQRRRVFYCVSASFDPFVFRTDAMKDPEFVEQLLEDLQGEGLRGL
jgi:hypothetical protein